MTKTCCQCQTGFEITEEDLAFYAKISPVVDGKTLLIPAPTLCPQCRQQRRLSFRNERFLYNRKCDLSGKALISQYPPDTVFPVYEKELWVAGNYEIPFQNYDFSRPFFQQFQELQQRVPRPHIIQQGREENSLYTNAASNNKNCYLLFSANFNQDCYYGAHVTSSRDCLESYNVHECELCYECLDCYNCYNLKYAQNCLNCSGSAFLQNCSGVKNSLFCVNLRNKEYYIYNRPYTKDEYEKLAKKMLFHQRAGIEKYREGFHSWALSQVNPYRTGSNNENSIGNYISNTKNGYYIYECRKSEDLRYAECIVEGRDCMDVSYWGRNIELVYETQGTGYNSYNIRFSHLVWENCSELFYCNVGNHLRNCFGCIGLRKKEYCILNKQYTKGEYEELLPRIIKHMQSTGEWGEFFPGILSSYGYNETVAQDYHPLSKEKAVALGFLWRDSLNENSYLGPKAIVPDDITKTIDTTTQEIFTCVECERNYKIIDQELQFCRKMGIPLPQKCFNCRHVDRVRLRNPRRSWSRECAQCKTGIITSFSPEKKETIVCDRCYSAIVE